MNFPLTICKIFGLRPSIWMIRNPMKIYEFQEIINGANLNCNHRVLDFGCGKGHWSIIMSKKCKHVTGIDINPKKIILSKKYLKSILATKKVEFICNDLISQQFPDSSFDRLISLCVLEHINNLEDVLYEIFRILAPNGELHVSVDSLSNIDDAMIVEDHKIKHAVHQYFTRESLSQILTSHGFELIDVYPILKGEKAKKFFINRINKTGKKSLVQRFATLKELMVEDKQSDSDKGIIYIARAKKRVG